MSPDLDRLNLLLTLGRNAEGEKAAREAIAGDPDWAAGYGFLALFLSNQGHHLPAIRAARDCVGKDPHDPWSHAVHAAVLNRLDRTDRALAAADEAVRLDPTYAYAHRVRCEILCTERRYREARNSAIDGLRHHPLDEMLLHWKGWAEYMLGRTDAAVKTAEEGLRTHADSPSLRNVLGCALMDVAAAAGPLGRLRAHRRAEAALAEAVRLRPAESAYQENRRTNLLRYRQYALYWLFPVAGAVSLGLTLASLVLGFGVQIVAVIYGGAVGFICFTNVTAGKPGYIFTAPVGWLGLPTVPVTPEERRSGVLWWWVTAAGLLGAPAAAWVLGLAVFF